MNTRDAIKEYIRFHPAATVREIQEACKISSPSVVHYHLERMDTPRTVCCPQCGGKGRVRALALNPETGTENDLSAKSEEA